MFDNVKKDKYAIKFLLKREKKANWMNAEQVVDINKTMCITSKQISGNDVLKEYVGDSNFATKQSRFQGHEFARIWADNENNDNLLIDIQGSDLDMSYEFDKTIDGEEKHFKGKDVPTWTYHYCDLTLDDFSKTSVDYSDYDPTIEYDENNLRLKLDSNHAYNDDEILITPLKEFVEVANDIDDKSDEADTSTTTTTDTTSSTSTGTTGTSTDTTSSTSTSTNTSTTSTKKGPSLKVKDSNVVENQLFLKKTFDSPFDLSKYTGLKIKFTTETQDTTAATIEGLGLYISSEIQSEVPSNIKYLPENVLPVKENTEVLTPTIDPDTSSESYYEGQLLAIKHDISDDDGDKIFEGTGYYQYVKHYNEDEGKYVYKLEQALDLRPYTIYNFGVIKATPDDNTYEARIELDQDSTNLRNVKEIGIISLNN